MKTLKALVLVSVSTVSAFAQNSGFFINGSVGTAQMKTGDFAVFNPVASVSGEPRGESLAALDKSSRVSVARLTLGYIINENWDVRFSYADYGTGDVQLAAPLYPGMVFINPPDKYTRHELKYASSAFALLPTFTHSLSDKLKLKIGAGLTYSQTSTHLEATVTSYAVITNPSTTDRSYANVSDNNFSYLLSLGADYLLTDFFSICLYGNYTTFKTNIPPSPWANSTKSRVHINSLGAELSATWRW